MQAQKPPVELEGRNAEKFVDYWRCGQRFVNRFNLKHSLVHRSTKTSRKHINLYLSSKPWEKKNSKKNSSPQEKSGVAHPAKILLADMHWRVSHNILVKTSLISSLLFH